MLVVTNPIIGMVTWLWVLPKIMSPLVEYLVSERAGDERLWHTIIAPVASTTERQLDQNF